MDNHWTDDRIDQLDRIEAKAWTAVADAVLRKIEEIQFTTGRSKHDPFADNNLPTVGGNCDTVAILRKHLEKFRDDYALMTAWLAWYFKTEEVAPAHLIGPLMEVPPPSPTIPDRLRLEKSFQVAYDALLFVDGNGFCCKGKDMMHTDSCTVVRALCEIEEIKRGEL